MIFSWTRKTCLTNYNQIIDTLLQWYEVNQRVLPWRATNTKSVEPFFVLISEIMLQQTVVKAVIPYYERFTERFKTSQDLKECTQDELFWYWQGLGYYRRALNLQKCAKELCELSSFPSTFQELIKLPGVGAYTAAAVASICFNEKILPVDGNIARVLSRLYEIKDVLPLLKKNLLKHNYMFYPQKASGQVAQAYMDLGATICTPSNPKCEVCPLTSFCLAFKNKQTSLFPVLEQKKEKPTRYGTVYWIGDQDKVLVQKRKEPGLPHGLMEFPSTPWLEDERTFFDASSKCVVKHTFTHFHLKLCVEKKDPTFSPSFPDAQWVRIEDLQTLAFPTLMKKVAHIAKHILT